MMGQYVTMTTVTKYPSTLLCTLQTHTRSPLISKYRGTDDELKKKRSRERWPIKFYSLLEIYTMQHPKYLLNFDEHPIVSFCFLMYIGGRPTTRTL